MEFLDTQEVPWSIVTNGSLLQMDVIKSLGLDRSAKALVVSSLVDIGKRDRTIFELAGLPLGFANNLESMLFVGDNPIADIAGAHDAGM
jgi:HAD superfamily hydrolase (TIGR01549 family)